MNRLCKILPFGRYSLAKDNFFKVVNLLLVEFLEELGELLLINHLVVKTAKLVDKVLGQVIGSIFYTKCLVG